jgi:hypothetical protein
MDEDNFDNQELEQDELEAEDTTVDTDSDDSDEGEPEPKRYRAWDKQEEGEKKVAKNVSYDRFREINEERKAAESKLAEYETKLKKYEEREAQVKAITDPDDLDINDFDTPQAYLKEMNRLTKEKAIAETEERFAKREAEKAQEQYRVQVLTKFNENISRDAKSNPDVMDAVKWMDKNAGAIDDRIKEELLFADNAGELAYRIATDENLVKEMFNGDPKAFIRKMIKLSAKIEAERENGSDDDEQDEAPVRRKVPEAFVPKSKATLSVRTKSGGSREPKTYAEYVKWADKNMGR